jgi:hypothetical protein
LPLDWYACDYGKARRDLLHEIARVKSPRQTLSAFVRESLQADIRRRKLRATAETCQHLLSENEKERAVFEEWESAPLSRSPKRPRK